jgi:hypothetical protein
MIIHSFIVLNKCGPIPRIVTDLAIRQRIFENQAGRELDATDDIAHLLSHFMQNYISPG